MTLDEIRQWYEANKIHTMYQGHWCRTCSIGKLLGIANAAQEVVENKKFSSVGFYISELEERVRQDGW